MRALRLPKPGASVQPFLDELAAHGLVPDPCHLPDWEGKADSFQRCLDRLFRYSPPTALFVDEAGFFVATMMFLQSRGLRVPEDVSVICTDGDPHFAWCRPPRSPTSGGTRLRWDTAPVVRRAMRWTVNLAEFIEGGTIGPARRVR